jgi:hypothetical protein
MKSRKWMGTGSGVLFAFGLKTALRAITAEKPFGARQAAGLDAKEGLTVPGKGVACQQIRWDSL